MPNFKLGLINLSLDWAVEAGTDLAQTFELFVIVSRSQGDKNSFHFAKRGQFFFSRPVVCLATAFDVFSSFRGSPLVYSRECLLHSGSISFVPNKTMQLLSLSSTLKLVTHLTHVHSYTVPSFCLWHSIPHEKKGYYVTKPYHYTYSFASLHVQINTSCCAYSSVRKILLKVIGTQHQLISNAGKLNENCMQIWRLTFSSGKRFPDCQTKEYPVLRTLWVQESTSYF